jgi:ribosomal protein L34E
MFTYERSNGYITEEKKKKLWPRCELCEKLLNHEERTFGVGKCARCVTEAAKRLADEAQKG